MTFDAKPLGEQPTKMIPAAISGGRPDATAKPKPTIGMIENWQIKPINMPLGILPTRTKSCTLMDVPIPNMMIINKGTINDLRSTPPTL